MPEVSAHELAASRDCRIPNCTNDASDSALRGPYAKLCQEHERAARKQRAERGRGSFKGAPPPSPGPPPVAAKDMPSLKEAAQKLVPIAAEFERALVAKRTSVDRARAALEQFNAALRQVKEVAEAAMQP